MRKFVSNKPKYEFTHIKMEVSRLAKEVEKLSSMLETNKETSTKQKKWLHFPDFTGISFDEAFAVARRENADFFTWRNNEYKVEIAEVKKPNPVVYRVEYR